MSLAKRENICGNRRYHLNVGNYTLMLRQLDTSCPTQVEMTVVSALVMLPAGVIFPALQRAANTPPASQTLERIVRKRTHDGPDYNLDDELMRQRDERDPDCPRTLPVGMRAPRVCVSGLWVVLPPYFR